MNLSWIIIGLCVLCFLYSRFIWLLICFWVAQRRKERKEEGLESLCINWSCFDGSACGLIVYFELVVGRDHSRCLDKIFRDLDKETGISFRDRGFRVHKKIVVSSMKLKCSSFCRQIGIPNTGSAKFYPLGPQFSILHSMPDMQPGIIGSSPEISD